MKASIGIVIAPSAVVRIEAVNACPNPLANASHRAKRQMQQRRQSIDAPPFGEL